jgi:hypothetical protein
MPQGASGINVLAIHPGHGMIGAGTQDGVVQCWDPRTRERLGSCSPFDAVGYLPDKASPKEVIIIAPWRALRGVICGLVAARFCLSGDCAPIRREGIAVGDRVIEWARGGV